MARSLRNVRQAEAIRAFIRLGGEELKGRGKGSHRVVTMPNSPHRLTVPGGILKIGLLESLIKTAGLSEDEFMEAL